MKPSAIANSISQQQGKVLRYIVSRGLDPTSPKQTINKISWSDLPHSFLEAKRCFNDLVELKLIKSHGKKFVPTELGAKVLKKADNLGLWKKPPPPHIINKRRKK